MGNFWLDSIQLMSLGMSTVFVFLTLLVIGTTLMSTVVNKLVPPEPQAPLPIKSSDDTSVAVVAAAAYAASRKTV
jgi:oxaloacetate decarboxylase gamma subunit